MKKDEDLLSCLSVHLKNENEGWKSLVTWKGLHYN